MHHFFDTLCVCAQYILRGFATLHFRPHFLAQINTTNIFLFFSHPKKKKNSAETVRKLKVTTTLCNYNERIPTRLYSYRCSTNPSHIMTYFLYYFFRFFFVTATTFITFRVTTTHRLMLRKRNRHTHTCTRTLMSFTYLSTRAKKWGFVVFNFFFSHTHTHAHLLFADNSVAILLPTIGVYTQY